MEKTEKQLIVKKIDNGIVIDHLKPGLAFHVLKALRIDNRFPHSVFIAMNVPSKKLGRKDVLKIRNVKKEDLNFDLLGLIIADSNVVYINNYQIVDKERIPLPKTVHGIIKCPGLSCITNLREDVEPEFKVLTNNGAQTVKLRCEYCDKIFSIKDYFSFFND
ncbi:MAG: aspartate carbamoyltransferase regulatory subunit [Candidatus Hodarchaeales archaeon]